MLNLIRAKITKAILKLVIIVIIIYLLYVLICNGAHPANIFQRYVNNCFT